MPRFIAVHPTRFSEDQLQPLAREPVPEGVRWVATYVGTQDERSFCEWEAPDADAILGIFTQYGLPYEALHRVVKFDPSAAVLEKEEELAEVR